MRKHTNILRVTSIVLLASGLCAAQEIKTVVAEGVGSNPQNAAQDAAQNALTNVVGSFIDANKQLEKRTEIRDGIRSQTAQITTDIKEYSQGSIQSFEIVETKQDGSLFRVTAKVGVRVAEFRAYVKKLAEGEVAVGGGLFAEMTTTQKQSGSLAKILSDRILAVVNGEVVKFSVGKPVSFRQSRFADVARGASIGEVLVNQASGRDIGQLAKRFSPDQLVVFDVRATLDEAFLTNFIQTLESVAASKRRVPTAVAKDCTGGGSAITGQQGDSGFCLPLLDSNPATATVYRFSNVDHELATHLPWTLGHGGNLGVALNLKIIPDLEVAVLDKDKREIQVELVSGLSWRGPDHGTGTVALEMQKPWLLYAPYASRPPSDYGAVLYRERTFTVVMKIDDTALRQADSIRVRLVK